MKKTSSTPLLYLLPLLLVIGTVFLILIKTPSTPPIVSLTTESSTESESESKPSESTSDPLSDRAELTAASPDTTPPDPLLPETEVCRETSAETAIPEPEATETEAAEAQCPETTAAVTDAPPEADPSPSVIRVYINQGRNPAHAAWETGAYHNDIYESDITFGVGLALARLLKADPRFEVKLSRPTPETVLGQDGASALREPIEEANAWRADYLISLYSSISQDGDISGIDAVVGYHKDEAYALADTLLTSLSETVGLPSRGIAISSNHTAIKRALCPSVILNLGYISHPRDASLLTSSPEAFARGIYAGLQSFCEERK